MSEISFPKIAEFSFDHPHTFERINHPNFFGYLHTFERINHPNFFGYLHSDNKEISLREKMKASFLRRDQFESVRVEYSPFGLDSGEYSPFQKKHFLFLRKTKS